MAVGAAGAGLILAGCASAPEADHPAAVRADEVLGAHADAQWGAVEEFSRYPLTEIRTKVSEERVIAEPLVQKDGRSFSGFSGRTVGYPASLKLENRDVVAAEIVSLDIWRRPEGRFGSYEAFLGSEPILLQPGDVWEGSFIVSRKNGWFRMKVRPAAPEGWEPVHGSALRNVFFQSVRGDPGDRLHLVFWNLGETEASFRYWVADGIPDGIPEKFTASGTLTIASGKQENVEVESPRDDWALVTKPTDPE